MLKRILVLDDNEDILSIVHDALAYEQFEVKSISGSENFGQVIEEFRPDLVILDYRMSGVNGGQVCQYIKTHPTFNNTPVIIFSAYINHYDEILAYGCDAVMDKPFDLAELIGKVNDLIH
jgi:DNA-binding response OmpR family regulator